MNLLFLSVLPNSEIQKRILALGLANHGYVTQPDGPIDNSEPPEIVDRRDETRLLLVLLRLLGLFLPGVVSFGHVVLRTKMVTQLTTSAMPLAISSSVTSLTTTHSPTLRGKTITRAEPVFFLSCSVAARIAERSSGGIGEGS